jgi:hypothetical protein
MPVYCHTVDPQGALLLLMAPRAFTKQKRLEVVSKDLVCNVLPKFYSSYFLGPKLFI